MKFNGLLEKLVQWVLTGTSAIIAGLTTAVVWLAEKLIDCYSKQ